MEPEPGGDALIDAVAMKVAAGIPLTTYSGAIMMNHSILQHSGAAFVPSSGAALGTISTKRRPLRLEDGFYWHRIRRLSKK